jgi:hypothetical protein
VDCSGRLRPFHALPTYHLRRRRHSVDLALDSPPIIEATISKAGPTFAADELAACKMIAFFDRAAPRDFADVFQLSAAYAKGELLALASDVDRGFDLLILVEMLAMLPRHADRDLPVRQEIVSAVRQFFAEWVTELRS